MREEQYLIPTMFRPSDGAALNSDHSVMEITAWAPETLPQMFACEHSLLRHPRLQVKAL